MNLIAPLFIPNVFAGNLPRPAERIMEAAHDRDQKLRQRSRAIRR